jgi:hypothetical protein
LPGRNYPLHLLRPGATRLLLLSDSRSQFKILSDFGEMWRNRLSPTFYNGRILPILVNFAVKKVKIREKSESVRFDFSLSAKFLNAATDPPGWVHQQAESHWGGQGDLSIFQ